MFSISWRRAPIIGAALLLVPGLAAAQTRVPINNPTPLPAKADQTIAVTSLKTLPQGVVKNKAARKPFLSPGQRYSGVPSNLGAGIKAPGNSIESQTLLRNFATNPQSAGLEPPDYSCAVGPTNIVVTTNDGLEVFDFTGKVLANVSWLNFLGAGNPALNAWSDPSVVYDNYHGKFLFTITGYNLTTNVGRFYILRTDGSDGTVGWRGFRSSMRQSSESQFLHDFPRLGFNDQTVFISCSMFILPGLAPLGNSRMFVYQLSNLELPAPSFSNAVYYASAFPQDIVCPANMLTQQVDSATPSRTLEYFVSAPNGGGTAYSVYRYYTDWAGGSIGFTDGTYYVFGVGATSVPPPANQPFGAPTIQTDDCRIMSASFMNGELETAQNTSFDQGGAVGIRPAIKTDHMVCAPMRDSGGVQTSETFTRDVTLYVAGYDAFYAAQSLNADGDAGYVVGATNSTGGLPPSLFFTAWRTSGLDTSIGLLKAAENVYNQPPNRWGDYSCVALDPFDSKTWWAGGEYVRADGSYGTWIGEMNYKPTTTLVLDNAAGYAGTSVNLVAHLSRSDAGDASGQQIAFTVNGAAAGSAITDAGGTATLSYAIPAGASAGDEPTTATFERTVALNRSTASAKLTVSVAAATTLNVPDVTLAVTKAGTLTATLNSGGSGVSGKTVTIKVDSTTVGTPTTDASGNVSVPYTPAEGTVGPHTISASYAGDPFFAASSGSGALTVTKADTTTTAANVSGSVGATVTLSANLSRNTDGAALGGKTVSFKVGGSAAGSATTDGSGNASVSYTIPEGSVGSPAITATFDGSADANYNSSSGSGTLTASKSDTTLVASSVTGVPGQAVTLSAKLTRNSDGAVLSGLSVTFTLGSFTSTVATNGSGVASTTYTIPAATTAPRALPFKADFAGDANYKASHDYGQKVSVVKPTTLTVAAVKGAIGAAVTLKATLLNGKAKIQGATVSFTVDGSPVGSAVTDVAGNASLTGVVVPGPIGGHAIVATFAGDATYNAATGNGILTATVANTVTAPDSPTASGTAGSNVTIGATLKNSSAVPATPLAGMTMTCPTAPNGTTDGVGHVSFSVKAPAKGKKATFKITFPGTANYKTSFTSIVVTGT